MGGKKFPPPWFEVCWRGSITKYDYSSMALTAYQFAKIDYSGG